MTGNESMQALSIRERVEAVIGRGQRCAGCFVEVLDEEGVQVPSEIAELAPTLERGLGGTGSVCGVFVAALLTRALQEASDSDDDEEETDVGPSNEWLDAFTPYSLGHTETAGAQKCSALARRLKSFAREQYGGIECDRISGVEWPMESAGLVGLYFSGGGAERCNGFIIEAAQAFLESVTTENRI